MKTLAKTLYYACVLSMTMSCSSTPSSNSDDTSNTIDTVTTYQIDDEVKVIEEYDMSSSNTSTSSEDVSEIIDFIPIHQVDDKVNAMEVYNMGNFPIGQIVPHATVICNFDSVRGVKIEAIDGDNLVSKCNPSLDSIEPGMLISIDFKLKVPKKKGPFDASIRVYYKNVKKPSIFKLHGYAE